MHNIAACAMTGQNANRAYFKIRCSAFSMTPPIPQIHRRWRHR
jgi:hypothetical protein